MKAFRILWIILPLALIAILAGCAKEQPTAVSDTDQLANVTPVTQAVGPAWESYILSEAKYALNVYRTGGSNRSYCDGGGCYAMSDWDYPHSDPTALARLIQLYGSNTGDLGLWQNTYRQGGWCKFFVDMVLYRSSYGYPNGHLYLPGGTYNYPNPRPVGDAQPGWILQKASGTPHTVIVVARFSTGLDVIDCNYIGGNGNYAIARHLFAWGDLGGYSAYRAHECCQLKQ